MKDDDWELFQCLAQDQPGLGDHPTLEALSAYYARELPFEESELVCEHFIVCPECIVLFFELDKFLHASDGGAEAVPVEVADLEQAAAWTDLRDRLSFQTASNSRLAARSNPSRLSFFAPFRSGWRVAAVLAMALASGVFGYKVRSASLVEELRVAQSIHYLSFDTKLTR